MTDRGPTAEEIAKAFRDLHFLNIALAASSRTRGALGAVCDLAETALVRALKEAIAGAKPEWKTIDSAPKDGTRILIYEPMPADPRGWFDVVHWAYYGRDEKEGWVDSEGAVSCDGTHWQPLDPANLPPEHQDEGK